MTVELSKLARDFASQIQHLLNATICNGVKLTAIVRSADLVIVGYGLTKDSLEGRRFPVQLGNRNPQCWMKVSYRLCLDDAKKYLTVITSYFGIYAVDDEDSCLCHIDYERHKGDGYPEAHLQVYGRSPALQEWRSWDGTGELRRLHFPVGGRRFRPILEDAIEFLITEKLVEPRPGWRDVVEDGRREFMRHQLRAAIRRRPEEAKQALKDLGEL
jgi:hypothetical protein